MIAEWTKSILVDGSTEQLLSLRFLYVGDRVLEPGSIIWAGIAGLFVLLELNRRRPIHRQQSTNWRRSCSIFMNPRLHLLRFWRS